MGGKAFFICARTDPWQHDGQRPGRGIYSLRNDQRRVLIIERDCESAQTLQASLLEAGFSVTVLGGSEDVRDAIERSKPHLVMLDWEHAICALSLIRYVQRDASLQHTRLIALSPYSDEEKIVAALELGVDDYVVRPYSLRVLMARVRALLRTRPPVLEAGNVLEFHRLRVDLSSHQLMIGSDMVTLRPLEYRLIEFLVRHPERVFTRQQMLRSGIWPTSAQGHVRAVDVAIQRTRKALCRHACGEYLQTVRAVGYRLSARS